MIWWRLFIDFRKFKSENVTSRSIVILSFIHIILHLSRDGGWIPMIEIVVYRVCVGLQFGAYYSVK